MTSLPASVQALLTLFQGPLSTVRFADVDAAALTHLADEVNSATLEAERQEAKLVELRQAVAQQQEAMLVLAQRALAYARVYAENDELLTQELNRITLPRPAKARKAGSSKSAEAAADDDSAKLATADRAPSSNASPRIVSEADAQDAPPDDTASPSESELTSAESESAAIGQRNGKSKRRAKGESLEAER